MLYGGILLVAGHSILAIEEYWAFYTGLGLIVAGVGLLKPNISTMVGGLYKQGDIRRDKGFTIFYIGINVGAFLSSLIVGYVGEVHGWHYGFGLAGIGMLAGVIVFWDGIKKGVFKEEGLQPAEYIEKKYFNFNIVQLVYVFAFLIVPVFAYLIILVSKDFF